MPSSSQFLAGPSPFSTGKLETCVMKTNTADCPERKPGNEPAEFIVMS